MTSASKSMNRLSCPAGTITARTSRLTTNGSFSWRRMGYSVETGVALEASAAFSVCQHRLAHFTLAGYSRTPASRTPIPPPAINTWASGIDRSLYMIETAKDLSRTRVPIGGSDGSSDDDA